MKRIICICVLLLTVGLITAGFLAHADETEKEKTEEKIELTKPQKHVCVTSMILTIRQA